mmetsp:Transcript_52908/g.114930  ORF Transcript_52908/g.114930 Transcript_52908/m.114930 type:complete len:214 (+) Transcript_52908:1186-1827(+)
MVRRGAGGQCDAAGPSRLLHSRRGVGTHTGGEGGGNGAVLGLGEGLKDRRRPGRHLTFLVWRGDSERNGVADPLHDAVLQPLHAVSDEEAATTLQQLEREESVELTQRKRGGELNLSAGAGRTLRRSGQRLEQRMQRTVRGTTSGTLTAAQRACEGQDAAVELGGIGVSNVGKQGLSSILSHPRHKTHELAPRKGPQRRVSCLVCGVCGGELR